MAEANADQAQRPTRYGDIDDDDDEYLSDDVPNKAGQDEDDEYAKQQREQDQAAAKALPANVKSFITSLRAAMSSSNLAQIHNLYTSSFSRLTQEHYSEVEWPEVEVVQCLTDGNEVFGIFYKELYYRHVYSRLTPTVDDRFSSYENYCAIFNYILNSDGPVPIELPVQWLWDLVDEFVWQFSAFSQYRARTNDKSADEIALLAENPQVWSCYSVLNVLYSLIQKSKIQEQLRASKLGQATDAESLASVAGEYGTKPLYRNLGMYSLVSLVRVHALLGDYTLALKMLDDVDMKKLPTRDVPAAHVSVHYYVGFCYMMVQRYSDAIYHLSKGYLFYAGPKRGRLSSSNDAVAKQSDRMLALLAMSWALSPTKWEDTREVREARDLIRSSEKYSEQLETMSRGGEASLAPFEDLFKFGCPKVISPHSPPYDDPEALESYNHEQHASHVTHLFMKEVKTNMSNSDLRTLLKLYTSIGAQKLATLANKNEDDLLRELLVLKGNMVNVRWTEASSAASTSTENNAGLLAGEEVVSGNIGFSITDNNISVSEQRRARQFTGRFLSQGLNARMTLDQLRARPLPAPVVAHGGSSSTSSTAPPAQPTTNLGAPRTAQPAAASAGGKSVAWAATKA